MRPDEGWCEPIDPGSLNFAVVDGGSNSLEMPIFRKMLVCLLTANSKSR